MKKGLFCFIILFSGLFANAQSAKQPFIIEPRVHTGMILPFYEAMEYLIHDDIYVFDLSVGFPTYGKSYWEKLYRYPISGAGYSCWSLGNNDVFGQAHALYGYVNIPFFRRGKKFSFNYQISFGGAYFPKTFDKDKNPLNRAIGSHTNIYVRLGIDGRIRVSPRCEMIVEAGTTHFSNGKTKSPNYGINAASFSLGLNYLFGNTGIPVTEPEIPGIGKRYIQSVSYSAGSKVYDNLLGKRYFTSSVSYNMDRLINHKIKIGLGADVIYDGSISEALKSEDGTPEEDFSRLIRAGLHVSYSVRYKQLIMGIQAGDYLYSKYTVLTRIYSKISLQYMFTENIAGSIAVRSHMGKADCTEYGIVYYW